MNRQPANMTSHSAPKPAEDFQRLFQEGIGLVEQMGSRLWTDYNAHDPGITILEALCYAITDLAYRIGWDVKDILAERHGLDDHGHGPDDQGFFAASEILTVNPTTSDDFRRLLIDLEAVRNAWIFEADNQLGLRDVLLELEADPELGDLNDRKIEHRIMVDVDSSSVEVLVELRFPELETQKLQEAFQQADWDYECLLPELDESTFRNGKLFPVRFQLVCPCKKGKRRKQGKKLHVVVASMRFFFDHANAIANQPFFTSLVNGVQKDAHVMIERFLLKEKKRAAVVDSVRKTLLAHRNLCEDWHSISVVKIEEVSICADIEATPEADLEQIQAQIWFALEQSINPAIPFRSLRELVGAGMPSEEIFNGPKVVNGFVGAGDLQSADRKSKLRASDVMGLLMGIEGVIAVPRLHLTKHDDEGNPIADGSSWLLSISPNHQPRLHFNASRFLFHKNGMPFLANRDEAMTMLARLRGEGERPKLSVGGSPEDLPVPQGTMRDLQVCIPVQFSLPSAYGVGPEGLPVHASSQRHAKALQLRAYLMAFEQILGNAFSQLAHVADLFSLNPRQQRTYFLKNLVAPKGVQDLDGNETAFAELVNEIALIDLDAAAENALRETLPESVDLERRSRFLDHLAARFGEHLDEIALLMDRQLGRPAVATRLIRDKASFIRALPTLSRNRALASDGRLKQVVFSAGLGHWNEHPSASTSVSGLRKRISLLFGGRNLAFCWQFIPALGPRQARMLFKLKDQDLDGTCLAMGRIFMDAEFKNPTEATGRWAFRKAASLMARQEQVVVEERKGGFLLRLRDEDKDGFTSNFKGRHPRLLSKPDAEALRDDLLRWSVGEHVLVVEHLLLRPKLADSTMSKEFLSLQLTVVLPGWLPPFAVSMEARSVVEQSIWQMLPAHLLANLCWAGNEDFAANPKWSQAVEKQLTAALGGSGCLNAAKAIHRCFKRAFRTWLDMEDSNVLPEAVEQALGKCFAAVQLAEIELPCRADECSTSTGHATACEVPSGCVSGKEELIKKIMVDHFSRIAAEGLQFERLEDAWHKWLDADADFDWAQEERMMRQQVEAILAEGGSTLTSKDVEAFLQKCGQQFGEWMATQLAKGTLLNEMKQAFAPKANSNEKTNKNFSRCSEDSKPAISCFDNMPSNFNGDQKLKQRLSKLLCIQYAKRIESSFRLRIFLSRLRLLKNVYPAATLHDWEDGNEQNPVRLDKTVLGC